MADLTVSTAVDNMLQAANNAAIRSSIGSQIGVDVQAFDAALQSIAGLTTLADRMIYATASDVYAVTVLTSFARSILDDATASDARTTLGLGALAVLATINNDQWSGTDLSIANGGTGSSTASDARTALGLAIGSDVEAFNTLIAKLNVATEWTAQQNFNQVALTPAGTVAWNLNTQQVATLAIDQNSAMGIPSNLVAGSTYILTVTQDSTARTLTWPSVYRFPGGTDPVLSTGSGAVDKFFFESDGTNMDGTFAQDYA